MRQSVLNAAAQLPPGSALPLHGTLYRPAKADPTALILGLPGGGASAKYFDLGTDNGEEFSFVRLMTERGFAVLTIDHVGTGLNGFPGDAEYFGPHAAADMLAKAFQVMAEEAGLSDLQHIGIAHSMGGMVLTIMQARHQLFERLALLGSSARGLDWGLTDSERKFVDQPEALHDNLEQLVISRYGRLFPAGLGGPSGKSITFGGSNEEMTARLRDAGTSLYAAGATTSMVRGSFAPEAGQIDVPIFFAFGDHDIGAPPEEAVQDFPKAASVRTLVLEHTGHNHFAFPTITRLCDELTAWINA